MKIGQYMNKIFLALCVFSVGCSLANGPKEQRFLPFSPKEGTVDLKAVEESNLHRVDGPPDCPFSLGSMVAGGVLGSLLALRTEPCNIGPCALLGASLPTILAPVLSGDVEEATNRIKQVFTGDSSQELDPVDELLRLAAGDRDKS